MIRLRQIALRIFLTGAVVCALSLGETSSDFAAEHKDRQVDRAALLAQQHAVKQLAALAKKHQGTYREPILLMRLTEAQQQAADFEFRIAHGEALRKKKPINLASYQARLRDVIASTSRVIEKYPQTQGIVRMYFARATSFVELKDKESAKRDYRLIAARFPGSTWQVRSDLALSNFAVESGQYKEAIAYLKKIEAQPQDPHYPLAIYQMAWAYFNLGDNTTGIQYLRHHIDYFARKRAQAANHELPAADRAQWEHSLRDVVTFFFQSYEKRATGYALSDALPLFRSFNPEGYLGNMFLLFGKLLRSRDRVQDLNAWKEQVIKEEHARPEALDMLMVNYEYLAQRRLYDKMLTAAEDFPKLDRITEHRMRKSESYGPAQALLLASANSVQKVATVERRPDEALKLSRILASIYGAFTAIAEDEDARITQVHYNLAELLFRVKDFDRATEEYGWVLEHWRKDLKLTVSELRLKRIAARYQFLLANGKLPKDLKPAALTGDDGPDLDKLDKPIGEWIEWVDAYRKDFASKPTTDKRRAASSPIDDFEFETNRILYAKGQTKAAIARLLQFVVDRPGVKAATGSASLILDTYLHNQMWAETLQLSESYLKMRNLGNTEFRRRLIGIPGESFFKTIDLAFKDKDYKKSIEMSDQFLQKYPGALNTADCLFLASRAALALGDQRLADRYLSELLRRFPRTDNRALALLARAQIEETEYEFDGAARDYREYLGSTTGQAAKPEEKLTIVRRGFFLNWLSRRPSALDCRKHEKPDDLRQECDRYQALTALAMGYTVFDGRELVRRALSGVKENRALWAAVGLRLGKKIALKDRLSLTAVLSDGWKTLDPLLQFALVPVVNQNIPEVFSSARHEVAKRARLKQSSRALTRRVNLIRDFETAAGKVVVVPWAQVKVAVLAEVGQVYQDFCNELAKLPTPKGISAEERAQYRKSIGEILDPFRAKAKQIQGQAMQMAAESSVNPTQIPGMSPARKPASKADPAVPLTLLDRIDDGAWTTLVPKAGQSPSERLRALWVEAVKARAWSRVGHFFQEYKEKTKPDESTLNVMRAITLSHSGAQAEAIAELESARSELGGAARQAVEKVLAAQYLSSSSPQKAKKLPGAKP